MADEDFLIRLKLDLGDANSTVDSLTGKLKRLNDELERTAKTNPAAGINKTAEAQRNAAKAADSHAQSLSTTRYALYGVSQSLGIAGASLIALAAGTYAVSIAWERDFANVVRTSQVTGTAVNDLRKDFIELQQTIPVTSSDLAEIGALGGQLGVAASDLANFTSVVARFSATTNLTADAAATAFGRLNALLPDVDGNFESLSDSILNVGVNSVATESQITGIATQISSMGNYAGLTADEVIGLAGALASVGVAPELARGTITRTFTLIGKAVSSGGDELNNFAKIAGVSSEEFRSSFGTDKFGPIFLKFVNGLDGISASGGDAVAALASLGITSTRDVPALLRLATASNSAGEAGKLLNQTFRDASQSQAAGTTLEQYAVISETVAAKLQLLLNNFNALLTTIGQGGALFGGLLDYLNDTLKTLTDLAENPFWNVILQGTVLIAGLVGVLALVGAAVALSYAGIIGLTQALVGMSAASIGGHVSLTALLATMRATGAAGKTAALGITAVGTAFKALSIVGIALIIGEIGSTLVTAGLEASGAAISVDNLATKLAKSRDIIADITSETSRNGNIFGQFDDLDTSIVNEKLRTLAGASNDFEKAWTAGWDNNALRVKQNVDKIDDAITQMIEAGDLEGARAAVAAFGEQWDLTAPQVAKLLDNTTAALDGTKSALDPVTAATDAAAAANEELATSLGVLPEQLEELKKALVEGGGGFAELGDLIQRNQDVTRGWAEKQSEAVYDSKDSWQEFYDGTSINLKALNDDLAAQLVALQNWQSNLGILVGRGVDEGIIANLARMGPEGAPLVAALVDDTTGEFQRFVDLSGQTGTEAVTSFSDSFTQNAPLLQAAFAAGGDDAVRALQVALGQGNAEVAAVLQQYGLTALNYPIPITAKPAEEQIRGAINSVLSWISGSRASISLGVDATGRPVNRGQFATGGAVYGAGTGTSDSINARLSNGEYVIRAASVRKYGMGMFDQLNRGVAKFANGGPVMRTPSTPSPSSLGVSPRQLRGGASGDIVIMVDGREIARAVNAANGESGLVGAN